jgi:hypothetical protein
MGADKVFGSGVVDVLKVGLPGLVFLLAYMSYRLLGQVGTQSTSPRSLRNAQRFMIFTLALTLLVIISSTIDVYLKKQEAISAHDVSRCHDAVARVQTASSDLHTTPEDLRATVNNQLPSCDPLFEKDK